MAQKPAFPAVPVEFGVKLQNADGTSVKDFIASPAGGAMIGVIRAASDDTAAVTLQFKRAISGEDYVLGEVQIPAGAGTNGTAGWVDVLASINLGEAMNLPAGSKLRVAAKTAVASGKTIDLVAEGGQF